MNFRHAYYARVRRVDRLPVAAGLAIVSDHVEGTRLSDVLRVAHQRGLQLDTNAALCLIRQLVPAVSLLHENARDASHGLIAPERLVVTPHARLVIVEHVLGSGIEQLQFARERLWHEFRVAIPSSAGMARFDHRADVNGIGITALSLVLGRPLTADEVPHAVPQLLDAGARAHRHGRGAAAVERVPQLARTNPAARRSSRVRVCAGGARRPRGDARERSDRMSPRRSRWKTSWRNITAALDRPAPSAPLPLSIVPPPVTPAVSRTAGMPPAVAPPAPFSMTSPMPPPFAGTVAPAPSPRRFRRTDSA